MFTISQVTAPQTAEILFPLDARQRRAQKILPVFLPFAGCPHRCIFCAQDRQTGAGAQTVSDALRHLSTQVKDLLGRCETVEIAFYGGTFTALPEDEFQACLKKFMEIQQDCESEGSIANADAGCADADVVSPESSPQICDSVASGTDAPLESSPQSQDASGEDGDYADTDSAPRPRVCRSCVHHPRIAGRCSTRPDACSAERLQALKAAGIDLVELGIQSFDSSALRRASRGYDADTAVLGCQSVLAQGLQLGIQLMPGMPGVSPAIFLEDVRRALSFSPACLRFYPCLVPDGTGLAELWQQGNFVPWDLETTVSALGEALAMAWAAQVPVIRLSVAPEQDFDRSLLAGPRHPALGGLVKCEALLRTVRTLIAKQGAFAARLELPAACSGYLYGEHKNRQQDWTALGLASKIFFSQDNSQNHAERLTFFGKLVF